jgi:diguanylate cyclase (GGDEF)-like protein
MDAIRVLQAQTTTDELTRLHNRRGFTERAQALIWEAGERKTTLSMVVCDLDHFKRINDRFGHASGDKALQAFAEFINGEVRQSDLIGRIGGEEFCLLLSGADITIATRITEGLRNRLADQDFTRQGVEGKLTVSCGIAELCPGDDYESLFKRADAALYSAKRNGRNRVEVKA